MKKSMPDYINELSGDDFDILEEIFINKYQKFIQLYWMISQFNDNISHLKYNESDTKELNIEFKVSDIKPDKVLKELELEFGDCDNISIWVDKKNIHISITDSELNDDIDEES